MNAQDVEILGLYGDRIADLERQLAASEKRCRELEGWNEWPNEHNEAEYPPDETPVLIYCGNWASKDCVVGQISKRCGTYGPSGATHWKSIKAPAIAAQRQKEGE